MKKILFIALAAGGCRLREEEDGRGQGKSRPCGEQATDNVEKA